MKISVETDNPTLLPEAVESNCTGVRFGPEFCEKKIPSLDLLKRAYQLVVERGKQFIYITPFVSNKGLHQIMKQLSYLNTKGAIEVVVNDLGILNVLERYPKLRPHMGRQLVFIPARCPWPQITEAEVGFFEKRRVARLYYQTNLNYPTTIRFYQRYGIEGVDLDWIPPCFTAFNRLAKKGFNLSLYLHLIPAAVTRKCHMARFLGEKRPDTCSKPCNNRAFLLMHDILDVDLYLNGNVVFRFTKPSQKDLKHLDIKRVDELIIQMNPITNLTTSRQINEVIREVTPLVS